VDATVLDELVDSSDKGGVTADIGGITLAAGDTLAGGALGRDGAGVTVGLAEGVLTCVPDLCASSKRVSLACNSLRFWFSFSRAAARTASALIRPEEVMEFSFTTSSFLVDSI
jgi:hypothetical protein